MIYRISLPKSLLLPDLLNQVFVSFLKIDNSFIGHCFANKRFREVISATPIGTESAGAGESRVEKEE